jgi:hypothetical protein
VSVCTQEGREGRKCDTGADGVTRLRRCLADRQAFGSKEIPDGFAMDRA